MQPGHEMLQELQLIDAVADIVAGGMEYVENVETQTYSAIAVDWVQA